MFLGAVCVTVLALGGETPASQGDQPAPPAKTATESRAPDEAPRKVVRDASWLQEEPSFTVSADGVATVLWKTRAKTHRGCIHYGAFMPGQELDVPRWYGRAAEKDAGGKTTQTHEARFSVKRLAELARWYGGAPNGVGRAAVRIVVVTPTGVSRHMDRVFGVRWVDGRFRRTAAIVEGPFLCLPTSTSMTVALRTDLKTHAQVTVVGANGERMLFESAAASTCHEIALRDLFADTAYEYHVRVAPADDPALSIGYPTRVRLRTAPPPEFEKSFTFAHLCDSRAGVGGGEWAMEGVNVRCVGDLSVLAYRQGADIILFPGDLVNGYTTSVARFRQELRSWKRAVGPVGAHIPVVVTAGNHEALIDAWSNRLEHDRRDVPMERVFAEEFVNFRNGPEPAAGAPPYEELVYSFDYGNAHFAVILTNYWYTNRPGETPGVREGVVDDRQLAWLEKDLAGARSRQVRHLFVVGHEPGFPCGGHVRDAMYWNGAIPEVNAMRDRFWTILGAARVVAYLCGDEHNYSRLQVDDELVPGLAAPVWQIVSGGAGAPFYVKDESVPWSDKVAFFTPQQHVCLFEVAGPRVILTVLGRTGGVIERVELAGT